MIVTLPELEKSLYTVDYRVLSNEDGHFICLFQ